MTRFQGLVAIGHGMSPQKRWHPGAANGGIIEHDWAARAVYWTRHALERCGVDDVYYESDGGEGHQRDPNFSGSIAKARALDVRWAVELHLNAGGGTGTETLYAPGHRGSTISKSLATYINRGVVARMGLRDRGVKAPDAHAFLKSLAADGRASVIGEAAFVDGDYAYLRKLGINPAMWRYGEGVAAGICAYLRVKWVPPQATATPPEPPKPVAVRPRVFVANDRSGRLLAQAEDVDVLWEQSARPYLLREGALGNIYTREV